MRCVITWHACVHLLKRVREDRNVIVSEAERFDFRHPIRHSCCFIARLLFAAAFARWQHCSELLESGVQIVHSGTFPVVCISAFCPFPFQLRHFRNELDIRQIRVPALFPFSFSAVFHFLRIPILVRIWLVRIGKKHPLHNLKCKKCQRYDDVMKCHFLLLLSLDVCFAKIWTTEHTDNLVILHFTATHYGNNLREFQALRTSFGYKIDCHRVYPAFISPCRVVHWAPDRAEHLGWALGPGRVRREQINMGNWNKRPMFCSDNNYKRPRTEPPNGGEGESALVSVFAWWRSFKERRGGKVYPEVATAEDFPGDGWWWWVRINTTTAITIDSFVMPACQESRGLGATARRMVLNRKQLCNVIRHWGKYRFPLQVYTRTAHF